MDGSFFPGDLMFKIVPIFIGIGFVIVISFVVFTFVKGMGQWRKNEQSPRLSVPAVVKSKRTKVSGRSNMHHHDDDFHHHSSTQTSYFVAFEFESGDRSEFHVSGKDYGLLAEDDIGILTFQGTRYLGFERKKVQKDNL